MLTFLIKFSKFYKILFLISFVVNSTLIYFMSISMLSNTYTMKILKDEL